jgi:hypothetical protein
VKLDISPLGKIISRGEFENRVPRKIFVTKSEGEAGTGGNCFIRSFMICTTRQI